MTEVADTVDDALDALSTPTTSDDTFEVTRAFPSREIASAAAARAMNDGGGSMVVNVKASSPPKAAGNQTTDDSVAIQGSINSLKQSEAKTTASAFRGGIVYLPPGRYKTTTPLTMTSMGAVTLLGPGLGRILNNRTNAWKQYSEEPAAVIYSNVPSGRGAVEVVASDYTTGYGTQGIVLDGFGIKAFTNSDGVVLDNTNTALSLDEIHLRNMVISGGRRSISMSGGSSPFNVYIDKCFLGFWVDSTGTNHLADYGIYSDQSNGPGICTVIRDTVIREYNINNVCFEVSGGGQDVLFQNCTFESTQTGAAVRMKGFNGSHYIFDRCHFEQHFQQAYWRNRADLDANGLSWRAEYYSKSNATYDPAGVIEFGTLGANANMALTMRDCTVNCSVAAGGGAPEKTLPAVVAYSGRVNIFGGVYGPSDTASMGQPVVVAQGNLLHCVIVGAETTKPFTNSTNVSWVGGNDADGSAPTPAYGAGTHRTMLVVYDLAGAVFHTQIPMLTKSGAVSDADFDSLPQNGTQGFDHTNSRRYEKLHGSWRYWTVT